MRKLSVSFALLLVLALNACAANNVSMLTVESQPPTLPVTSTEAKNASEADGPLINLTLIKADKATQYQRLTEEELTGIYNGVIDYTGFSDVLIKIDGADMSLREAILDQHISVENFIAGLQTDARNGYCKEIYETDIDLTHFLYRYNTFEVAVFNDVWEAPNGEKVLARDIWIRQSWHFNDGIYRTYLDDEGNEVGRRKEDWGLTFEVIEATPTCVKVNITQHGGQQFGQLEINIPYAIIFAETGGFLRTANDTQPRMSGFPSDGRITMNGTTEFTFDWSDELCELPSGKYWIDFGVNDVYNVNTIHPFTKNYTDYQMYYFEFEIP